VASICSTVLPACGRVAMPWIEALLQRCLWALQSMRPGDGGAMLMAPGPLVFFVLTPSVLVLLAAFSRPWKLAAIAVILVTLMSPMVWGWRPAAESLQLDILDVGQGTAVVVRTRRHALLVDAGPAWPGGSAGAMTVLPFLQSAAIDHLDALLVSHDDNDHSGGVTDVLTAVPADLVLAPRQIAGANAVACRAGMNWEWDSVHFALLHPSSVAGWSDNDASCVLSIRYRGTHILLPGDIEAAAETVLIARAPTLHADVVVVPHHGSKTSSGAAFIAATRPRYAVYTTAFWNRWQFPAESVRRGWRSSGACQLNTATTGMLRFRWSDSVGLQLQTAYNHSWARPAAVRSSPAKVCTEH